MKHFWVLGLPTNHVTNASFSPLHSIAEHPGDNGRVCTPLRAVYPAALCTKSPSLLSEGEKNIRKRRLCPPALLSTMRRGARPVSGSLNMVTTRRAEGFSPPTTKGTEPPASVLLYASSICHTGGGIPEQPVTG